MPHRLPVRHSPRRNRALLAMSPEPSNVIYEKRLPADKKLEIQFILISVEPFY